MYVLARSRRPALIAGAAILGGLLSCAMLPIPVAAQPIPRAAVTVEQYVSHARLNPGIVGAPARLTGVGARLLYPLARPGDEPAARLLLGGFAQYAPGSDPRVTAVHYGLATELRLRVEPIAGRAEPLLSLGLGAFRTQHEADASAAPMVCVRGVELPEHRGAPACLPPPRPRPAPSTDLAASPALGVRVGLAPGLALRADVRDVIVYRGGGARHNPELATGVSVRL